MKINLNSLHSGIQKRLNIKSYQPIDAFSRNPESVLKVKVPVTTPTNWQTKLAKLQEYLLGNPEKLTKIFLDSNAKFSKTANLFK